MTQGNPGSQACASPSVTIRRLPGDPRSGNLVYYNLNLNKMRVPEHVSPVHSGSHGVPLNLADQ